MRRDASNDFLVEPLSFTIAYVDPDIAGKRVGEKKYSAILMALARG